MNERNVPQDLTAQSESRRALLKKVGRYATVSAPAVTLLLAASTKPVKALVSVE
jgi:hypothetical protein